MLALNRLRTRAELVEENGLSGETADRVFSLVKPIQFREDGTPLYLESIVDGAIEDTWYEASRPTRTAEAFSSEKENPSMIAAGGISSINRLAELAAEWLERTLREKQLKEQPRPQMLTPEEAAKIMHVHVQTVTAWCREGRITATKLARKWLISRQEIDRYLHRNQMIHGNKKGGAK